MGKKERDSLFPKALNLALPAFAQKVFLHIEGQKVGEEVLGAGKKRPYGTPTFIPKPEKIIRGTREPPKRIEKGKW